MKKMRFKPMNQLSTGGAARHGHVALFFGFLFLFIFSLSNTLALTILYQSALNPAYVAEETHLEVTLIKREIDLEGNQTETPILGAEFLLFNADTDEQIILDDVAVFITNEEGRLVFQLPPGHYVIREHRLPNGFGPDKDDEERPLTSWTFIIHPGEDGTLELVVNDKVIPEEELIVYNRRLSGGELIVEKTVVNEDGSALTDTQLAQVFEFIITFSDDGEYTFVIDEGDERYSDQTYTVASGESFFLKHGQRAVFNSIPHGVAYLVVERVPDNFHTIGRDHQGIINSEEPSHVTFVNTDEGNEDHVPPEPRYGSLLVGKEVRGEELEELDLDREFKFVVVIGDERHEFTLKHEEYREFIDIPVGTRYVVYEYDYDEEGYLVSTIRRTGYMTARDIEIWFINRLISEVCPDYPECPIDEDAEGDLEIGKTVLGEEVDEAQLFDFTLTLTHLHEDELEILVDDEVLVIEGPTYEFNFGLRHGEVFRIEGLPQGVRYDVIEHLTPGFIQEITRERGMIFARETAYVQFYNEMIPEDEDGGEPTVQTSLRVCKEVENEDSNFPSTGLFIFALYIDGEVYERFELRAGACRDFERLEVGASFEVIEVDSPDRYELISSGTSTGTLTEAEIVVTFVNRDTLRDIPVEKLWDVGEFDVPLPTDVTIHLMADGQIIEIVRLMPDEHGRWNHLFTVPRYDLNGSDIDYQVVEVPLPDWLGTMTVSEGKVTLMNTVIPPEEKEETEEEEEEETVVTPEPPEEEEVEEEEVTPPAPPSEEGNGNLPLPEIPPQSRPPQTGDQTQVMLWLILSWVSAAILLLYLRMFIKGRAKGQ